MPCPESRKNLQPYSKPKLAIELLAPMTNGKNLHHALAPADWRRLSAHVINESRGRCEICKVVQKERSLVCHERWSINSRKHVQRLVGLQAICSLCHSAVHYGRAAGLLGVTYEGAFDQLCRVNGWTRRQARRYISEAKKRLSRLPQNYVYRVDLSYAEKYGCKPLPLFSHDVEEITDATFEGAMEMARRVEQLSKRHRIVIFQMDSILTAGSIVAQATRRSEKERLLRELPRLNSRDQKFVGQYGRKSTSAGIYSDLLKCAGDGKDKSST